jgi:translocator assembly and maintenance protein 41
MMINNEFKESLRQLLWKFRAPIRYAFAYGSGVFPQSSKKSPSLNSPHPKAPEAIVKWQKGGPKMIDFIFGVSHTEHWHSLNMQQNPHHYSAIRHLGSGVVSQIQDNWGAGVYFNPYVIVDGIMIKYGVVNIDNLIHDLTRWDTLYLAGRLQKPVKILRDDARVRLANQINLISALRAALLMLGPKFTERQLYAKIAALSYMGDPRMDFSSEDPNKVRNIVNNQAANFRMLYAPLVKELPNVAFTDAKTNDPDWLLKGVSADEQALELEDCALEQDMDPIKRGNAVRRLPISFRTKLYYEYRKKWQISGSEFDEIMTAAKDEDEVGFKRRLGSQFDRRIAEEPDLKDVTAKAVRQTVKWPSWSQSVKSFVTAGVGRSLKYMGEKRDKGKMQKQEEVEEKQAEKKALQEEKDIEEASAGTTTDPKSDATKSKEEK